jgi:hypothetical protein
MPAATTEIFSPALPGNACCEVVTTLAGAISCNFGGDVATASTSGTAVLDLQYANSAAGPWNALATSTANSQFGISTIGVKVDNGFSPVTGATDFGPHWIRVLHCYWKRLNRCRDGVAGKRHSDTDQV